MLTSLPHLSTKLVPQYSGLIIANTTNWGALKSNDRIQAMASMLDFWILRR